MSTSAPRPLWAATRLTTRITRRTTLVIALAVIAFLAFEVAAFNLSYPDEAARQMLLIWAQDPGVRIIAGSGSAVNTVGGFVIWDAGLYVILGLGAWALMTTTRLLRGEEDSGRTDLLLVGPARPLGVMGAQVAVLLASTLLFGTCAAFTLIVMGAQVEGAALFGAMVAGYCAFLISLAALVCQIVSRRRTAVGLSAIIFALLVFARMIGNSSDTRYWLTWLSPAGWMDHSQAFGDNHWWLVAVPVVASALLLVSAMALRARRDLGGGLIRDLHSDRSTGWGTRGLLSFSTRSSLGSLLGWAGALFATAAIIGALLPVVSEVLTADTGFLDLLAVAGVRVDELVRSFVAMWGTILGALIALAATFRMGAVREEESSGRAETLLARPVSRMRWLGVGVSVMWAGVVALALVSGVAIWASSLVSGAELAFVDAFATVINALPAGLLLASVSVAVFGIAPRVTVPVGVGVVVVAYVLEIVGPALSWPQWLLAVSPFHHLPQAPIEAIDWTVSASMLGVALLLTVLGLLAFRRRDLLGQ